MSARRVLGDTPPCVAEGDAASPQPRPAATFPVRLAVAKLGGPCARSGREVVPASSPALADELKTLQSLPGVADVAVINRLLMETCHTMGDVRAAARGLEADILLAWTLDARTEIDDHDIGPLSLATFGFAPNQEAVSTVTASAAFIDTRTGFVYGVAEASENRSKLGNSHNVDDIASDTRRDAGKAAISSLQPEVERAWKTIVERFGDGRRPGAPTS